MRIGKITNANIETLDVSRKRSVIQKDVPLYAQSLYYDMVITNWTLSITGYLVGVSNADLDSQIQAFNGVVRSRGPLWVDCSDKYPGQIHFVRISDVSGPKLAYAQGPFYATFTITALILLPWGTTHLNPWNTQSGIVLHDLNGNGEEWVLNPLQMNCNYTASPTGGPFTSFSWEFIIDNQNPFTEATSFQWNACDSMSSGLYSPALGAAPSAVTENQTPTGTTENGTASSPISKAYTNPPTSGNTLVAVFLALDGNPSSATASDTIGNTWSTVCSGNNPNTGIEYVRIFTAQNKSSASDTVSVTYSGGTSPSYTALYIYELICGGSPTFQFASAYTPVGVNATTPLTTQIATEIIPTSSAGVEVIAAYTMSSWNTASVPTGSGFGMNAAYTGASPCACESQSGYTGSSSTVLRGAMNWAGGINWFGFCLIVNGAGAQTSFSNASIDSTNYEEGAGALTGSQSSPAASSQWGLGAYGAGWGSTTGFNASSFDRIRAWVRFSAASQTSYYLEIADTSWRKRRFSFSYGTANLFLNLEFSINDYTSQDTGFDITNMLAVQVRTQLTASPPASIAVWLDDVRLEKGYIDHGNGDLYAWSAVTGTTTTLANDTHFIKNSQAQILGTADPSLANTSQASVLANIGTPEIETSALASFHYTATANGSGVMSSRYTLPIGPWDLTTPTAYDFLVLWVWSDFGGNSTGTIKLYLSTTLGTAYYLYTYTNLKGSQWNRLVVPLRHPSNTVGSPNLNAIVALDVESDGAASQVTNLRVSEIALDVLWALSLEFHLPDDVLQSNATALQTYFWNPNTSSYSASIAMSGSSINNAGTGQYFLDGTSIGNINGNLYQSLYSLADFGTVAPISYALTGQQGSGPSTITYSESWGCVNRSAFYFWLPPATSGASTGNLLSPDLTGFQAFNKARIRVTVQIADEDTTYLGM